MERLYFIVVLGGGLEESFGEGSSDKRREGDFKESRIKACLALGLGGRNRGLGQI